MIPLILQHRDGESLTVLAGDRPLFQYTYLPDEAVAAEAPRPYAHPVYSPDGDVLTCFRPNDHPWHHALSLTLTSVGGVNFWGGPTCRREDGYQWREDHGRQVHVEWIELGPERLVEAVEWCAPAGTGLLRETRLLEPRLVPEGWTLRWRSELGNVSGRALVLGNYHASASLAGSHYTGLQFRGARGLLSEHGDDKIGVAAANGREGESAVHGAFEPWMEWRVQADATLRRTRIRFTDHRAGTYWFVRRALPLAAAPFHLDQERVLAPDDLLVLDYTLEFLRHAR
ncbi:MAG TPA: DUF6807 family protein [Opitutaceae bacterium]|nr:DUF6807 family protein [Opitutaceae bacterium]